MGGRHGRHPYRRYEFGRLPWLAFLRLRSLRLRARFDIASSLCRWCEVSPYALFNLPIGTGRWPGDDHPLL